jgi:pilus assembly protein TadC
MWVVAAALCAGWAVWNVCPPVALARLRPPPTDRWPRWLPNWARPRPDALPARTRWLAGAAGGLALTLFLWDNGPLSLLAGACAVPATTFLLGRFDRGADKEREAVLRLQAPGALDAMAACLEAGLPLRLATASVADLSPPEIGDLLRRVVQSIGVGLSDGEAWLSLADDPALGTLARDVSRAADWGTTVSALLTDHAQQLRRDCEVDATTRARAVGVRTVLPLSFCYLPAFLLLGVVPLLASGALAIFT